ncbi:MAG: hypothetical protein AAF950_18480 [Pseudomonadota bacterium]
MDEYENVPEDSGTADAVGDLPDRSAYNMVNVLRLREGVNRHLDGYNVARTDFIKHVDLDYDPKEGGLDARRFGEWLKHDKFWGNVTPDHYEKIIDYFNDNLLWPTQRTQALLSDIPDNLFHALSLFFGVHTYTIQNVRIRAPGLYKIYTESLVLPKHIVVGAMWISYDEKTHAVQTRELQIYSGDERSRNRREEYHGYLIRKSKKYMIVARDQSGDGVQVYFLPHFAREDQEIISFEGMVVGIAGGRVFSRPVVLERFDGEEEELIETLNIYPDEEISPLVLAHLKNQRNYGNLRMVT